MARQLIGIAPVGLDAVRSFLGDEGGGDNIADHALVAQMATEDEATWPGFVNQAQLDVWGRELFDQFIDGIEGAADDAVTADLGGVLRRDGNGDGIFVDVQADIMDDFVHGCLVLLFCYQRPSFKRGL